MSAKTKQLSNPFSTGGGGPNFETRVQADAVEHIGYQRLASTLRGVADSYLRQAERIIAEHKEELEE